MLGLPSAGCSDICRNKLCLQDVERLPDLGIVLLTEGNDVPAPVGGPIFLNMGTYFGLFGACFLRTVSRQHAAAVLLPMVEPASALAGIVARAVDVIDLHLPFPPFPKEHSTFRGPNDK